MSSEAKHRQKEYERLLRRVDPIRTEAMDVSQTTSNEFALVPESILEPDGRRRVSFVVSESAGDNAVDARIVKRIRNDEDTYSPWVPDTGREAQRIVIASGGAAELRPVSTAADQFAVEVRSNTGDWHGEVEVFGVSRAQE